MEGLTNEDGAVSIGLDGLYKGHDLNQISPQREESKHKAKKKIKVMLGVMK